MADLLRGKRYRVTWREDDGEHVATGMYVGLDGSLVFSRTRKAGGMFSISESQLISAQDTTEPPNPAILPFFQESERELDQRMLGYELDVEEPAQQWEKDHARAQAEAWERDKGFHIGPR